MKGEFDIECRNTHGELYQYHFDSIFANEIFINSFFDLFINHSLAIYLCTPINSDVFSTQNVNIKDGNSNFREFDLDWLSVRVLSDCFDLIFYKTISWNVSDAPS